MFDLTKKEKTVVIFLAVSFLIGAGLLSYRQLSASSEAAVRPDPAAVKKGFSAAPADVSATVSGAVLHPGTYKIKAGGTVMDVLDKAVPSPGADIAKLDLGAAVKDGEKIAVSAGGSSSGLKDGRININEAAAEELDKLPGIGPHLANKIIEYRGGARFNSPEDLKNVSGIGDRKYEALKDKVRTQ